MLVYVKCTKRRVRRDGCRRGRGRSSRSCTGCRRRPGRRVDVGFRDPYGNLVALYQGRSRRQYDRAPWLSVALMRQPAVRILRAGLHSGHLVGESIEADGLVRVAELRVDDAQFWVQRDDELPADVDRPDARYGRSSTSTIPTPRTLALLPRVRPRSRRQSPRSTVGAPGRLGSIRLATSGEAARRTS